MSLTVHSSVAAQVEQACLTLHRTSQLLARCQPHLAQQQARLAQQQAALTRQRADIEAQWARLTSSDGSDCVLSFLQTQREEQTHQRLGGGEHLPSHFAVEESTSAG